MSNQSANVQEIINNCYERIGLDGPIIISIIVNIFSSKIIILIHSGSKQACKLPLWNKWKTPAPYGWKQIFSPPAGLGGEQHFWSPLQVEFHRQSPPVYGAFCWLTSCTQESDFTYIVATNIFSSDIYWPSTVRLCLQLEDDRQVACNVSTKSDLQCGLSHEGVPMLFNLEFWYLQCRL